MIPELLQKQPSKTELQNIYRVAKKSDREMIQLFSYLYETISTEVYDEYIIIKEITEYYTDAFRQHMVFKKRIADIDKRLKKARNYDEWKRISQEHDELPQIQQYLNQVYSQYYDYSYIQELLNELRNARLKKEINKLIAILRSHSYRNIGNITSQLLYKDAYNSTHKLIEDFQTEVVKSLKAIMNSGITQHKKLQFFGELRHALGRSALLLSGGAILGMYHIGVVQTLMEADCMPTIIAGSSAGSMIASFIATRARDDYFDGNKMNFTAFINKKKHSLWRQLRRIAREGFAMDIGILKNFLRDNIGDYTFQEAFDKFGWILNITVTGSTEHDEDRLLNYLTAPNVLIWSACCASCAIPFIYGATDLFCKDPDGQTKPYTLMNKKFLDGSIGHDLPMNKLSVFFNVNNFIVSQTNPWVIPFMDYTEQFKTASNPFVIKMLIVSQQIKQFWLSEAKHRASQLAFLFPTVVTKFLNIFTQSYVGNITIWPVPSVSNYLRIMENPTDFAMILNFVEDGRSRTFPKIRQIKSSLFYQKQIGNCLRAVRKVSRIVIRKESEKFEENEWKIDDLIEEKDDEEEKADSDKNTTLKAGKEMPKTRNQSFMIPRQKSFGAMPRINLQERQ